MAAALFGGYWKGKLVAFSVDNQAVVEIIKKSHSKEHMHLIRLLTFYACHYGFQFRAEHITGKENILADTLSRKNVSFSNHRSPKHARSHL